MAPVADVFFQLPFNTDAGLPKATLLRPPGKGRLEVALKRFHHYPGLAGATSAL